MYPRTNLVSPTPPWISDSRYCDFCTLNSCVNQIITSLSKPQRMQGGALVEHKPEPPNICAIALLEGNKLWFFGLLPSI